MSTAVLIDEPSGVAQETSCFHCGQSLPNGQAWTVTIAGIHRPVCCPGCQAVAQAIAGHGLADYYSERDALPAALPDGLADAALRLCDEAVDTGEAVLSVDGLRCAACVWLIEKHLAHLPGVASCNMNVATGRLQVRWQPDRCKLSDILLALREIGYAVYPFDAAAQEARMQRAAKNLFRRLFVAGLSMMQVMMYAAPAYFSGSDAPDPGEAVLLRWASFILTLPAVVYSARPFFAGAWNSLKQRALGMDVPVALGIAAAFLASAAATLLGRGEVYFDSVSMFIFLLLCSRYLELSARRKASSALSALTRALPSSAERLPEYPQSRHSETVAAASLAAGDTILVKPGEAIPADGILLEGDAAIDVSLLTGESEPQRKDIGDTLPGGAVNQWQPLVLRVVHPVADSTLAALVRLAERAGQAKPRIAQWADRVAAGFVACLLMFTLTVFAYWQMTDPERAWPIAIAVLVVSCPCALSLATPAALAAATDALMRRGVLVLRPHVLETLHRATHVVFDKTGTLTVGTPGVTHIVTACPKDEERCLRVACALEASSAHPLAMAIANAARQCGLPGEPAADAHHIAGQGVEGTVDGIGYRIGNMAFVGGLCGVACPWEDDGILTSVYLGTASRWLARFDIADALRQEAGKTVARFLAEGKTVILLSGDRPEAVRRIAASLGIAHAWGNYLPEQKLAFVQALQRQGAIVAMAGDGINDAAVLRAADVSFAMGSGAALAQAQADAVLLSGRIDGMQEAAATAAKTMAVIRQNLAWSVLYNALAIPAAAFGWLNPWMSAVGMSLSSAVVVLNALRLLPTCRGKVGMGGMVEQIHTLNQPSHPHPNPPPTRGREHAGRTSSSSYSIGAR